MIRVAYVVSTLKRCGPSNQLRNIICGLDREQFEPLLITLSPESADSVKTLFEADGLLVISLNLSRVGGVLFARRMLKSLLRDKQIDLLHTQGLRADMLAASLRAEWPAVCSVRNFPQLDFPMTYGALRGKWMARSHTKALGRVAAPIGVSTAVARNLRDEFGVNARTICNGVNTEFWTMPSEEERVALRKTLTIFDEVTLWVSVGHLSERKDPLAVIEAFDAAERPNARLVFLGGGPQEKLCRDAAAGSDRIFLAGRVDNVSDWLRAADVFVSASHAEGFPNAVLEALACGLPCILSDIPPHGELAEKAGECIQLFEDGDVSAMARQIKSFQPGESFRALARAAAEETFSATAMSGKYQEIYRELSR